LSLVVIYCYSLSFSNFPLYPIPDTLRHKKG
jgi:hypothetical protein